MIGNPLFEYPWIAMLWGWPALWLFSLLWIHPAVFGSLWTRAHDAEATQLNWLQHLLAGLGWLVVSAVFAAMVLLTRLLGLPELIGLATALWAGMHGVPSAVLHARAGLSTRSWLIETGQVLFGLWLLAILHAAF